MVVSGIMLIAGAFWTAWEFENYSECGVNLDSARFTIRYISTRRVTTA